MADGPDDPAVHGDDRPLLVGLTGGIGSGKSTVSARFAQLGAAVVDADRIAREVVEPGEPALDELVERFGDDLLRPDGTLDRKALAAIVFSDDRARADLNAITHPRIGAELLDRVQRLRNDPPDSGIVILDVPLLTESMATVQGHDVLVVVEAPEQIRVQRVVASRDTSEDDVRARIRTQQTDEERRTVATHVIDNSGDLDDLYAQVDRVFTDLRATVAGRTSTGTM
ncbi:MAG TPA: dephospho-CoA kinase [Nitriliruptorales bacterium]